LLLIKAFIILINTLTPSVYRSTEAKCRSYFATRLVDDRIEPVLVAHDTDYAGFLDEIQQTGVEITNE
jgi:hypothetical protein